MFGKVAADVLGLSDVGKVIHPDDYDKVEADDYVLHEEEEQIYFLIKSKADEYCFTNRALIHVDGASATSKKRTLKRYDYKEFKVSGVTLETAGTVDVDVEIHFTLGNEAFAIDVHKKHLEELKDLYKTLIKISEIQRENEVRAENARKSLEYAASAVGRNKYEGVKAEKAFQEINRLAFEWLEESRQKYEVKDYSFVFQTFIQNS